jgi:hypothetical protein
MNNQKSAPDGHKWSPERGGVTCARLGATVLSKESSTSVCPDLAGDAVSTRRRLTTGRDAGRRCRRAGSGPAPWALLYASCSKAARETEFALASLRLMLTLSCSQRFHCQLVSMAWACSTRCSSSSNARTCVEEHKRQA